MCTYKFERKILPGYVVYVGLAALELIDGL
jgi:hypothetical protein